MSSIFPELKSQGKTIVKTIKSEESSFSKTLDRGISLFEAIAEPLSAGDIFPGHEAFMLYDTFGFPFDLTSLMATEKKLTIDKEEFDDLMQKQRAQARSSVSNVKQNAQMDLISDLVSKGIVSKFIGYEKTLVNTKILAILDTNTLILEETPFYPEGGGQQGDRGSIEGIKFSFSVNDTRKVAEGIILHQGLVEYGSPEEGMEIVAEVDRYRRGQMRRNHTATHLLNAALRTVIDPSIKQAGSLVSDDRLRFDFNFYEAIPLELLEQVEQVVNHEIMRNTLIEVKEMSLEEVKSNENIQAVFDDKYGDIVRVISIGDFSHELCGGTHVSMTGDIGPFRILSESSIASGVRRIEATTGLESVYLSAKEHHILANLSKALSVKPSEIKNRFTVLENQLRNSEKKLKDLQEKNAVSDIEKLIDQIQKVSGISLLSSNLGELPMDALRKVLDRLRQSIKSGIIVIGSKYNGKACFAASVSEDLISKGFHAGKIIEKVALIADGGGGGKPDKAQAGGKDGSKVDDAIKAVVEIIKD